MTATPDHHDKRGLPAGLGFLAGGGGATRLILDRDWSGHRLGPPEGWPEGLKVALSLVLNSPESMILAWGREDLTFFFNETYFPLLGPRLDWAMGAPFAEVWADAWQQARPIIDDAFAGRAERFVDLPWKLGTDRGASDTWWSFSYSRVLDADGEVAGLFVFTNETTQRVLADAAAREGEERLRREIERQRLSLRQMPGFVALLYGPEHRFDYVNDAYRQISGARDFVGRTVREVFPGLEGQGFYELLDRVYATGEPFAASAMPISLDREHGERFIDLLYEPIRDDGGMVSGVFVGGYDVTERRQAETAMNESEARFRNMADHAPTMMWVTDQDARCAYLNRAWYEFTGQSEAEGEGFGWLEAVHPEDRGWSGETFLAANARREPFRLEYRLRRHDGEYRWAIDAASPRFAPDGAFLGYIGSVIDIGDRHEMEERLRASEARYRTLFESIEAGFCVVEVDLGRPDGRVDYRVMEANPAFHRHTGLSEEFIGRWLREATPELEEHWFEIYGRVALTGEPERFEQGSAHLGRWFDVYAFRVEGSDGRRVAILFNDISARRGAEEALRDLAERLEQRVASEVAERRLLADLVEGTDAFVQVAGPDFRWLAINRAAADEFERIYGVRPQVGDSMLDLLVDVPEHRAAVEAVWTRALAGEQFTETAEFGDPSRDRRCYEMKFNTLRDADGIRMGAYQFVHDVTDRVLEQRRLAEAEEALRQSQKVEAMGQLTGGVAHDFNNLLTPIVGALDMLQRRGVGGERERRLIDGAVQSAERAKTLVQRLLAFARRQPLQPVAVDVAAVIEGMAELIASTTGPQIKVLVDVAPDLGSARADPNQLEMALLNLSVNARDAMRGKGTLRISASAVDVADEGPGGMLKAGRYVRLSVADTGVGMDEATLARAVEPFFSTKGVGKGTGLGLSMVHGLASQLGGGLSIRSRPGLGTNIELWLPQADEVAEPATASADAPQRPGRGTALLVDDEDLVRLSTADMLLELGYEVREAASAEHGMSILRSDGSIDLVVTDHLMPGMTGSDMARAIRALGRDIPILIISGYAESEGLEPDLPRLTKPFRRDELARSLAALHGSATAS